MSGFANSILGGAKKLIREAIESLNYVPGVSGWTIMRNGFAEFANAVIRGTLSANNGNVIIDSTGVTITGTDRIVRITAAGDIISTAVPATGAQAILTTAPGFGAVIFLRPEDTVMGSGAVFGPALIYADSEDTLTNARPYLNIASPAVDQAIDLEKGRIFIYGQSLLSPIDDSYISFRTAKGLFWNNYLVDSGMGWVTGAGIPFSSGAVGAETAVITLPSQLFIGGRAYRISMTGMVNSSVANGVPLLRFRKTNVAGLQIDVQRVFCPTIGVTYSSNFDSYFTCSVNQNTVIVLTLATGAGTSVLTGSANSPATVNIYDVGDAANFSSYAPAI